MKLILNYIAAFIVWSILLILRLTVIILGIFIVPVAIPFAKEHEANRKPVWKDWKLIKLPKWAWRSDVPLTDVAGAGAVAGLDAITKDYLAANSVIAGKIAAGAIISDHIGTNEIIAESTNIKDSVITSAKILSLDANKIAAGTIDVAVKLTAAEIIGGSITGTTLKTSSTVGQSSNGGGIKLTGSTLTVHDATGAVRVKLGAL